MNKFLKEPLLHFLIIGLALFVIYSNINEVEVSNKDKIHITKENLDKLSQKWIDAKGKKPNAKEKKELLDNFIKTEVLYREALKKGLEENDGTIKDHLAKKMKFVLDDLAIIQKPTKIELQKYFQNNQEKFQKDASISFNQVVFTYDKDKEKMKSSAINFLKKLQSKKSPKVAFIGDKVELSQKKIIKSFGQEFSDKIFNIQTKKWSGPFSTKHGIHLVYVHYRLSKQTPELSKIKDIVEAEFLNEKRAVENKVFYKKLEDNYKIIVD